MPPRNAKPGPICTKCQKTIWIIPGCTLASTEENRRHRECARVREVWEKEIGLTPPRCRQCGALLRCRTTEDRGICSVCEPIRPRKYPSR